MGGAAEVKSEATSLPTVVVDGSPIEAVTWAWLHEKVKRSKSQKTQRAYRTMLWGFRAVLQAHGLDLDGEPRRRSGRWRRRGPRRHACVTGAR